MTTPTFTPPAPEAVAHAYTEDELKRAVSDWLHRAEFAPLLEVTHPPQPQGGRMVSRRIDVLGVRVNNTVDGGGWNVDVIAVEIKRGRADFAADVRNVDKRAPWMDLGAHYYAVPADLADVHPPQGCGLLVVTRRRHPIGKDYDDVHVQDLPSRRHAPVAPPGWLLEQAAWRVAHLTGRVNGWADDATPVEVLHVELDQVTRLAARRESERDRAKDEARAWRALAAAQGHKVPCARCGDAVVPTRVSSGALAGWRHAQPELTRDCPGNTPGVGVAPAESTPGGDL